MIEVCGFWKNYDLGIWPYRPNTRSYIKMIHNFMTLLMVQKSCKPDKVGSLSRSLLVNLYIPGDQFRISESSQAVTGDKKN